VRGDASLDHRLSPRIKTTTNPTDPLALLLGLFELRAAGAFAPEQRDELLDELHGAAADLAARLDRLSRAVRFTTKELAGYDFLDVEEAQ
jgi:hypothetical protein